MKEQKRIALVNDISGFGRCSMTVELPLISAMRVQACPLPTAILSCHTGFPTFYIDDYTERMRPYIDNWEENGVVFDGIATGFLGSAAQIDIVLDFIHRFKKPATRVIVDPVMGDNGRLYASYTDEMCERMKGLLAVADIVTPNLTEACRLLDREYPEDGQLDDGALEHMAAELVAQGSKQVVITGLPDGEDLRNFVFEAGRGESIPVKRAGRDRTGTGDAFTAIVSAGLLRGMPLKEAVELAARFIGKAMRYAEEIQLPTNWGLPFEEFLGDLTK